jgi:hypothetical protein
VPVRLLSAAVCALGAHALLYGTFHPGDGLHGYFGWYEPAVALASLAALLIVRPTCLRTRLPITETARRVSMPALFILLVQESLERTVDVGRPAFAVLTPSQWLVLLVGVAASALLLAFALRAGHVVIALLRRSRNGRMPAAARWSIVTGGNRPARPLAARYALRAPPVLSTT